jgi:hypothetical protein
VTIQYIDLKRNIQIWSIICYIFTQVTVGLDLQNKCYYSPNWPTTLVMLIMMEDCNNKHNCHVVGCCMMMYDADTEVDIKGGFVS